MQVHSVIANTISEEILQKGHLSIRFMADGFSLLLEDQAYKPVVLNHFREETTLSLKSYINTCSDWLERHTLIPGFHGETTIISGHSAATMVPDQLFDPDATMAYMETVKKLSADEFVKYLPLRGRNAMVVFDVAGSLLSFAEKFSGKTRIMPLVHVLYSVADQVNASDHQRGFALLEVQNRSMGILIIREDKTILSNSIAVKQPDEVVYHTLNTLTKAGFNRNKMPLFICGNQSEEVTGTLGKYISSVEPLPYLIPDIDKDAISEHVILAEATHCD